MQNIDNNFKQISDSDYNLTEQSLDTQVATISTRQMQNIDSISTQKITKIDIPDEFRVDAKAFIERPFYVDKVVFSTSATRYSFLSSQIKFVPGDVARSNPSLLNVFKMAAYGRPELVLNMSIAGTITHAGCVLVGVLPPMPRFPTGNPQTIINTILSGPHAYLYANEATSVNIAVPWYCNTDLATTDMENTQAYIPTMDITTVNGNYATLIFYVLNPLSPSTGSSNSLNIIIEACFKNFDLVIPTPRYMTWSAQSGIIKSVGAGLSGLLDVGTQKVKTIAGDAIDSARTWVRSMTGLHNPNYPIIRDRMITTGINFGNTVDAPQYLEKLDPYMNHNRILMEPIFGTDIDEHSLKHISSKKQYLGSFSVSTAEDVGKIKWVRPISPFQGGFAVNSPVGTVACANNIETLHSLHRGWSGNLKLHIISVMNNKQQVKLKVIKMYNPSVRALSAYPDYSTAANAPSHLLEFTAGGQEQVVDLPFLCRNAICPCADNMDFEAMFHGLYYIYVAQNLVISDSSPNNVEFNIFLSAPDVTFYGYQTKNIRLRNYSLYTQALAADGEFEPQSSTIKVMNEPQTQQSLPQDDGNNLTAYSTFRLMPNIDIRPIIRRMYRVTSENIRLDPTSSTTMLLPLSSYLGENPKSWTQSPLMSISRMYYGKTVGFKFRMLFQYLRIDGEPNYRDLDFTAVRLYYVPQNITQLSTPRTFNAALINSNAFQDLVSTGDVIPLTYKLVADNTTKTHKVLEFAIPDTSFYKFMGGPQKFETFSSSYTDPLLSQADFGTLVLHLINLDTTSRSDIQLELFVGLTDESRMGYHSMAPPITLVKGANSFYLGTNASITDNVSSTLNPFTYLGGFL